MAEDVIDQAERLLAAASPGPWQWRGDFRRGPVLSCWRPGWGECNVMGAARNGMQGAQPTFVVDGRIVKALDLAVREVSYRDDIVGVEHPDAELIAAAPSLLAGLVEELRTTRRQRDDLRRWLADAEAAVQEKDAMFTREWTRAEHLACELAAAPVAPETQETDR